MMDEWLYKATDARRNGRSRPSFEETKALAEKEGVLCRSERTATGGRVANVSSVKAGDILHIFFRRRGEPAPLFIGSFRVLDPGLSRVEKTALASITEPPLVARLRRAYEIPEGEPVTGWRIESARDVDAPDLDEPNVVKFLGEQPTLVRYFQSKSSEDRLVSCLAAHLAVLPKPFRLIHGPLLVTLERWSYGVTVAKLPAARLIGEAFDEASAMEALAERIEEFVHTHIWDAQSGRLGGTLLKQWVALTALIDVSGVPGTEQRASA
jgi:hypothetical protein